MNLIQKISMLLRAGQFWEAEKCLKFLPHGSGLNGTYTLCPESAPNKVMLYTSFQGVKNQAYAGWIDFKITVTPDFCSGFTIELSPYECADRFREEFEEYLLDTLTYAFKAPFEDSKF